jgi:hypothetical protein
LATAIDRFEVTAKAVRYDREQRRSWKDGGEWPHANLYHFYEAVAASHFTMRGYHVLRDYLATRTKASRPLVEDYSRIFHRVVGPEASAFFLEHMEDVAPAGVGQPDLFVFREEAPNDPGLYFPDSLLWFFVEVKGAGDSIRDNQLRFWRAVASRPDLGLGPERIRLIRVLPMDADFQSEVVAY